jgi:hypothetical protein
MTTVTSISDAVAQSFLLPGTMACSAMGLTDHTNLIRMLVNSLIWTVAGVIVVAVAV